MLEQILGKKSDNISVAELKSRMQGYDSVLIDLGTGDGSFAYRYARKHPECFVIGIDADRASLAKSSAKAMKKPARGGCENAAFLCMNVLEMPADFSGFATKVHVNFPWGSLMEAAYLAEEHFMGSIKRLFKGQGEFVFYLNTYVFENDNQREHMGLTEFDQEYVNTELLPKYEALNFKVTEQRFMGPEDLAKEDVPSTWAGRLVRGSGRNTFLLKADVQND